MSKATKINKQRHKEEETIQNVKQAKRNANLEEPTSSIFTKIYQKICTGQIQINTQTLHLQPKIKSQKNNLQLSQKITMLNSQLQSLQQKITQQKEYEKQAFTEKTKAAQQFISKLKKQKQEHHNRIKFDQLHSRLKMSSVSQDILQAMKQRKESIVKERKMDMELRIFRNVNRKQTRQQQNAKNQVSYWVKVKEIQEKKRYNSIKVLPSIHVNNSSSNKNILNIKNQGIYSSHKNLIIPRKNSEGYKKNTIANSQVVGDYHDVVTKFLQRAKLRQQSYSQRSPNRPRVSSNIVKVQFPQSDNQQQNASSKNNDQYYIHSNLIDDIPHNNNRFHTLNKSKKRRQLGDIYLQQSKRACKKQQSRIFENKEAQQVHHHQQQQQQASNIDSSCNLQAKKISLQPNNKIIKLQQKYQKVLQKLADNQLDKVQAIEMLVSMQRRLDKIDPTNIECRLKSKLWAFEQFRKKNIIKGYKNIHGNSQQQAQISRVVANNIIYERQNSEKTIQINNGDYEESSEIII